MDTSKIKEFLGRLSFIKHYSSLLAPIIILMVGGLLFMPTLLISSKLKKQIADESISAGKRAQSLSKSAVSQDQWKVEQEYQQAYQEDANQAALLAKQSTQRELLSYKLFPVPTDTSTLIFKEFGRQYRETLESLISRVNGRDCPTEAEIQRSLKDASSVRLGRQTRMSPGMFSRGSSSKSSDIGSTIRDVLCRDKAESASVYANPFFLSGYGFWDQYEYVGMEETAQDCWYWQLAYWIIEDVIDTIDSINSGSKSVFTSPVKRLMGASFAVSGTDDTKRMTKPTYVLSDFEGLTNSPTKRICDKDIDVVHFNVVVIVSSKGILPFMQELCSAKEHKFRGFPGTEQEQSFKHNQITILESQIKPIDLKDKTHELYRYGDNAVVELDLICEYIFNKSGYDEIKPQSVKKELGSAEKE